MFFEQLLLLAAVQATSTRRGEDAQFAVMSSEHSPDGVVEVIDYGTMRFLRCGRSILGASFIDAKLDDQTVFGTFALLESAVAHFQYSPRRTPQPRRALIVGLGTGVLATRLREQQNMIVDVIERNAAVVAAAAQSFGYDATSRASGTTLLGDAAALLAERGANDTSAADGNRYDALVYDVFSGASDVAQLSAATAALLRDRWLHPDGLLLLNFVGFVQPRFEARGAEGDAGLPDPYALITLPQLRILRTAFDDVRCFSEGPLALLPRDEPSNIVCAAATRAPLAWDVTPLELRLAGAYAAAGLAWPIRAPASLEAATSDWLMLRFEDLAVALDAESGPAAEAAGRNRQRGAASAVLRDGEATPEVAPAVACETSGKPDACAPAGEERSVGSDEGPVASAASARSADAVRAAARDVDDIMWRTLVRPILPREAWGADYGAE